MASNANTSGNEKEFDVFNAQFDDQYAKDFTCGHKIWIENELIPEIRPVFQQCDPYRILAVGSGSGYADVALLQLLAELAKETGLQNRKIVYTVVEPDPKAVKLCQENLQIFSQVLKIDFCYKVVPSEKYIRELQDQFELIHFVHCISWVKKPPEILQKCYEELLTPSGTLAVVDFAPEEMKQSGANGDGGETPASEEASQSESKDDECKVKDDVWFVDVDIIAQEHKWNCRKFPNTIKQDYTEIFKKTDKGKKQIANFFGWDLEKVTDKEIDEASSHFCSGIEKEVVAGEERYFSPMRELVYILTKTKT